MTNSNKQNNYGREVSQESTHKDANGHIHTNATRTTETVNNPSNNSYQSGYINGQVSERRQEETLVERDNDNAARGLLLGILLTALAALGGGAIWFFNRDLSPAPVTPVVVPVPNNKPDTKPSPQASKAPEKTTIIEKTKEVLVPVPQPASPSPAAKQDINITVPNPASQPPAAPAQPQSQTGSSPEQGNANTTSQSPAAPAQPQSPTSSSPEQGNTNTSTSTPTEGTQSDTNTPGGTSAQTDATSGSSSSSDSAK